MMWNYFSAGLESCLMQSAKMSLKCFVKVLIMSIWRKKHVGY